MNDHVYTRASDKEMSIPAAVQRFWLLYMGLEQGSKTEGFTQFKRDKLLGEVAEVQAYFQGEDLATYLKNTTVLVESYIRMKGLEQLTNTEKLSRGKGNLDTAIRFNLDLHAHALHAHPKDFPKSKTMSFLTSTAKDVRDELTIPETKGRSVQEVMADQNKKQTLIEKIYASWKN